MPDMLEPAETVVLRTAVADGVITADQAQELGRRLAGAASGPAESRPTGRGQLAELAGYAGGALVLGAAGLFLGTSWPGLSDGVRAGVLFATAAVLLAAGAVFVVLSGLGPRALGVDRDSARRRLVSTLWALAAAGAAGGAGVLADGHGDLPVAAAATGFVVAAVTYLLVPGAPGHLATAVAAATLVATSVEALLDPPDTSALAIAWVALALAWAGITVVAALPERYLGLGLAAALGLIAAQLPVLNGVDEGLGYALTAGVAVAGYVGYLASRAWPVLAAGVVATTLVVPEALHDWTDGSVSVAGALLVAGLTLLGASAAGLKLRQAGR